MSKRATAPAYQRMGVFICGDGGVDLAYFAKGGLR